MDPLSFVRSAVSRTIRPISATASILIPAFVLATFTEEQTRSVTESASGIELISVRLPFENPFCTSAL